jgi:hypothetical protein
MAEDVQKQAWFEEFKKVSATVHNAAGAPLTGRGERRGHPRFSLHDAQAKLYRRGATTLFGLAGLTIEGAVLDLSEGGLRLETGEKFMIDTKVHLKMFIAKFNDTLEADGVTRWCHATPKDPEVFQVGIQFWSLDPLIARKITQMRGWYTSAQYKAIRDGQIRAAAKKKS